MPIHFPPFNSLIQLPPLKTNILTIQQKKIFLIASAAFAFLATCYIVQRCYSNFHGKSRPIPQPSHIIPQPIPQSIPDDILQKLNPIPLLNYLAKHGQQFSELDIGNFISFSDQELKLLTEYCPNLQKLRINAQYITNQGFQHLQALTALESLNLAGGAQISDKGLQHLQTLTTLQSLNLNFCYNITDQGLKHLQALKALRSLDLQQCYKITDQGLLHLQALTVLQSLDLDLCHNITDQGLQHLQKLILLQSLRLSGCAAITDQGLLHLQTLKNLESLKLGDKATITYKGLESLLAGLPSLEYLDLSSCNQFSLDQIRQLRIKNLNVRIDC